MQVHFDCDLPNPGAVPAATGRSAYRIVQEGLTNARKHAHGAAVDVSVDGAAGAGLTIEVRNRLPVGVAAAAIPGTGTGIVGLAERASLAVGDAERLPLADGCFDRVMVAFGIRNVGDVARALAEARRVLRPDGRMVILEFGLPRGPLGALYRLYFDRLLPSIGRWVSGDRSAYRYLPASVARFPSPEAFCALMRSAGFTRVARRPLTGGIAWLFAGEVAPWLRCRCDVGPGGAEPML
jgi:SAM-dependent methyltransferase